MDSRSAGGRSSRISAYDRICLLIPLSLLQTANVRMVGSIMRRNLLTSMCLNTLTDDKGNVDMHLVLKVILDVKRHIVYLQGLTNTHSLLYTTTYTHPFLVSF